MYGITEFGPKMGLAPLVQELLGNIRFVHVYVLYISNFYLTSFFIATKIPPIHIYDMIMKIVHVIIGN